MLYYTIIMSNIHIIYELISNDIFIEMKNSIFIVYVQTKIPRVRDVILNYVFKEKYVLNYMDHV